MWTFWEEKCVWVKNMKIDAWIMTKSSADWSLEGLWDRIYHHHHHHYISHPCIITLFLILWFMYIVCTKLSSYGLLNIIRCRNRGILMLKSSSVFWNMTPYNLAEVYWHFWGMYCFHLQGCRRVSQTSGKQSKPECGEGSRGISWGGSPKQANGREEKSKRERRML
jgi:hypothetical protein